METDKPKVLCTNIQLVNNRLQFIGKAGKNAPISIDYIPPLGDNLGYTSLELLLLSLSSCMATAVITFLRRMKKNVGGIEVYCEGTRHTEHPTGFKTITMDLILKSTDASDVDLFKIIQMGENTYCPVFAMVKGNVEIIINHKIIMH